MVQCKDGVRLAVDEVRVSLLTLLGGDTPSIAGARGYNAYSMTKLSRDEGERTRSPS